jgi:NitT/TauT family transport system substrate-binding protein
MSKPVLLPILFALAAASLPHQIKAADIVHVGIIGVASDIPIFLAEKKGYFAKAGLSTDLITFDSGAKMVAPLGAGQLDAGAGATSAGLYNALQQGISIKIVADKATNTMAFPYKGVLVRKALIDGGQFKSLADMKGRKVGVSAPGAADNSVVNEAVKKAGLTMKDIDRVYLGFSQQVVALSNGGIDVAFGAEPDMTQAVRQNIAVKFAPNASFYPVQTSAVVLFGGDFIAKHRDVAQKFTNAYLQAVRDYDDSLKDGKIAGPGADLVIAALMEMTKTSDASLFRDMSASWCNPDGKVDLASVETDLAYFKAQEGVNPAITSAQALDNSFVEAAVKQLGPYTPKN